MGKYRKMNTIHSITTKRNEGLWLIGCTIVLALAGCGHANQDDTVKSVSADVYIKNSSSSVSVGGLLTEPHIAQLNGAPVNAATASDDGLLTTEETQISEPKKAKGIYQGMADPHSAEIMTDEGPAVFQLDESLIEQVELLPDSPDGTAVAYKYTEREIYNDGTTTKQLWLIEIEALDE